MTGDSSSRPLLVAVSAALGLSLLVIAFLLGRESARPPAATTVEAAASIAPPAEAPSVAPDVAVRRWPEWADLKPLEAVRAGEANATTTRVEGRSIRAVAPSEPPVPEASDSSGKAAREKRGVSKYFLQMDSIRSDAGAGDSNAFAMDLMKAAMGNDMTGFDQLIADAQRMEAEARQITPPPSCEAYHQANLEALTASRELLQQMKTAISGRNLEALAVVAQKARALEGNAELLEAMREQLGSDSAP